LPTARPSENAFYEIVDWESKLQAAIDSFPAPVVLYESMIKNRAKVTGGCASWSNFADTLQSLAFYSAIVENVTIPVLSMSYVQINYLKSPNNIYKCKDPSASSEFLASLLAHASEIELTDASVHYCDSRRWAVQR
jgi:hypothetical protein